MHKGLSHSIWGVLDAALYPMAYLASVPLLMKYLSLPVFGIWIILNSLITILQLLNFNMGIANLGVAVIRKVTHAVANRNMAEARDIINGSIHITAILLVLAICTGGVLSYLVVKYQWWGIGEVKGIDIALCILLSAIFAGLKYFDLVFLSVIKAFEYFRLSSLLNMVNRFGLLIINVWIALHQASLVLMLEANIIYLLFYLILQLLVIKWIMPAYSPGRVKDTSLYKNLLHFSMLPWLQSVIIVITFQTDRFWVSSYGGLKEVPFYGLVSTMFNHIHIIFTAMAVWVMPRLSTLTSRGENTEKLYKSTRGVLLGIVTVSLLFFYLVSPVLFRTWLGERAYSNMYIYIRGFVAFEIVFAHTIMPFLYLNATGKERIATVATLIYCSVCYVFMITGLVYFHCASGLIGGMTLSMCLTMPIVNIFVQLNMHGKYSVATALVEMLPMYFAVILVYSTASILINVMLFVIIFTLLWKSYLSSPVSTYLWKRAPGK